MLPIGYNDAIVSDTDIRLSFFDRVRLLLGWKFALHLVTYCENVPGKVYSESRISIYRETKCSGLTGESCDTIRCRSFQSRDSE